MRILKQKYKKWITQNTPDKGSTSPKTGNRVIEQRVQIGPKCITSFIRWIGK